MMGKAEEIKKYHELLSIGAITEDEYNRAKEKILSGEELPEEACDVFLPPNESTAGEYNYVPSQTPQVNVTVSQPKKKMGCLSKIVIAFAVLIVLAAIGRVIGGNSGSSSSSSTKTTSSPSLSSQSGTDSIKSTADSAPKPTPTYLFNVSSSKTNMKVGEVNVDGSFYVGLSAVRATNVLYTATDWHTVDIPVDQEVVYVLLEVYNDSGKIKSYSTSKISVYADSSKAADPDTYTLVGIDGYQAYNSNELDPGTKDLVVDAFLVPVGWKELTVFAGDLSWTLTPQDVQRTPYSYSTLFDVNTPSDLTKYSFGDVVYSEDYTVIYDGSVIHTHNNMITGNEYYVVFEFTVNNTSSETLDYDLVGYNMRGYQNLRLLEDATYTMDDNINGYSNIHDVDEIKPGMSAKIYVAFEIANPGGLYTCAFDTGYMVNNLLAYVSAQG